MLFLGADVGNRSVVCGGLLTENFFFCGNNISVSVDTRRTCVLGTQQRNSYNEENRNDIINLISEWASNVAKKKSSSSEMTYLASTVSKPRSLSLTTPSHPTRLHYLGLLKSLCF